MHDNSAAGYPQKHFFNGGTSSGYVGFTFVLDSDNDGQVQLGKFSSSNVADFIGIADAAISGSTEERDKCFWQHYDQRWHCG